MGDSQNEIPVPPQMPGEAEPGAYGVRTREGSDANPSHAIFPIVRYDAQSNIHLLGTGFFITTTGLFVTARHVLKAPFDSKGVEQFPIGIVQFLPGGIYLKRPILRCTSHRTADVSVGVAAPMTRNQDGTPLTNPVLTLTFEPADLGARVVTFAYPKHANQILESTQIVNLEPTWYDGDIKEYYPTGRDRVLLPAPCYQTSIIIHGGASGGPVFSRSGCVFGLNSTGIDGTDISFISRINEILNLTIEGVSLGSEPPRFVAISEMIRAGHISVNPPLLVP